MLNIKPFNTSLIIFLNAAEIIFKILIFLVVCTPMARFVFSCIITSIAIASIWSSDSYTVHNSLLAGHVFKTIVSIDWLQCNLDFMTGVRRMIILFVAMGGFTTRSGFHR